ncbi:Beta-carotene 3-hydroxylase 2 [Citrus sinensis]|nr:Beta-carotene 3-hydroxylase 2 [Citrus sinensis]
MASGMSSANSSVVTYLLGRNTFFTGKAISKAIIPRSSLRQGTQKRKPKSLSMCFVTEDKNEGTTKVEKKTFVQAQNEIKFFSPAEERQARKRSERQTYLVAAIGCELQLLEMFGTFALSIGAAVGMEFWARWAHRALWHASLWHMHKSHHQPRDGPFELNDIFAVINAVPAIALLSYGFFHKGIVPGLCFGAGLGITVFGMAYMFVHDGLVHRRFPVGPIAHVPYLRKVAAAHQLHHSEKFNGLPYGLFLGPQELEEVEGTEGLDKET